MKLGFFLKFSSARCKFRVFVVCAKGLVALSSVWLPRKWRKGNGS